MGKSELHRSTSAVKITESLLCIAHWEVPSRYGKCKGCFYNTNVLNITGTFRLTDKINDFV